jgi:hypothetical protein
VPNGESGLYLDPVLHRSPLPPFGVENGELVIRSQQLLSPAFHDGKYWYHGAAVLTGQRMPATQIRYGQYEWTAKMPTRRGGWPALWLLTNTGWPPEIDVYEGFGYNSWWNFSRHYAANIHGGPKNNSAFTAYMQYDAERVFGIKGFEESTAKIVAAAETAAYPTLIMIGHSGPWGLGNQPEDICGKDWKPMGGDYGDPDLTAAIHQIHPAAPPAPSSRPPPRSRRRGSRG